MLSARALCKRFADLTAVDHLDLDVQRSEIVFLCGANGAGKTTTLKLFAGLLAPTSGTLTVDGISITDRALEARRLLSFVPESVQLHPYLSGSENLAYFLSLGTAKLPSQNSLESALVAAGLPEDALHKRAGSYSKGMRQKVVLALAALRGSDAVLLDEPTSGLDLRSTEELACAMRSMRERGAAVLAVSHDLDFVRETADRVAILENGRLERIIDGKLFAESGGQRAKVSAFPAETSRSTAPQLRGART
jgi:ABC-2 type transport system ATP-binding protein